MRSPIIYGCHRYRTTTFITRTGDHTSHSGNHPGMRIAGGDDRAVDHENALLSERDARARNLRLTRPEVQRNRIHHGVPEASAPRPGTAFVGAGKYFSRLCAHR